MALDLSIAGLYSDGVHCLSVKAVEASHIHLPELQNILICPRYHIFIQISSIHVLILHLLVCLNLLVSIHQHTGMNALNKLFFLVQPSFPLTLM